MRDVKVFEGGSKGLYGYTVEAGEPWWMWVVEVCSRGFVLVRVECKAGGVLEGMESCKRMVVVKVHGGGFVE